MKTRVTPGASMARSGFTFVEVVIAVIVLAVGVLGLAGTTAYIIRQVTLSDVTSRRAAALQDVLERVRAADYTTLASGSASVPPFTTTWTVADDGSRSKVVTVIRNGPGLHSTVANPFPMLRPDVIDTFTYRVIRP